MIPQILKLLDISEAVSVSLTVFNYIRDYRSGYKGQQCTEAIAAWGIRAIDFLKRH
jgi:hypothetical protein